jgi:hypothetical protein
LVMKRASRWLEAIAALTTLAGVHWRSVAHLRVIR